MKIQFNYADSIPVPYMDYSKTAEIWNPEKCDESFMQLYCAFNEFTDKEEVPYYSQKDTVKVFPLCDTEMLSLDELRRIVSVRLAGEVYKGLKMVDVAENVGISSAYLSKFVRSVENNSARITSETLANGKTRTVVPKEIRPFSVQFEFVPGIAQYVFHGSVHDMMFGESHKIVLPKTMRYIAQQIEKLPNKTRTDMVWKGEKLKRLAEIHFLESAKNKEVAQCLVQYGQYRPVLDILRERVKEAFSDNADYEKKRYAFCTQNNAPTPYALVIKGLITGVRPGHAYVEEDFEKWLPNITQIMFLSLATMTDNNIPDKALDFFLANDYIQVEGGASRKPNRNRNKIYTIVKGEEVEIVNTDVLKILSFCAALPQELKTQYISEILYRTYQK